MTGQKGGRGLRIPEWVQTFVDSPPRAGSGVHRYIFDTATFLHPYCKPDEIGTTIMDRLQDCGRPVGHRELWRQITRAKDFAWSPPVQHSDYQPGGATGQKRIKAEKRPEADPDRIKAITSAPDAPGLADLWELSPLRKEDNTPQTQMYLDALFPGNPWLCVGSKENAQTRRREYLRDKNLHNLPHILPNVMLRQWGMTGEGKRSQRALNTVGPWVYQVIEFDSGTFDDQAAIHLHLSRDCPLVLAVVSGGKSLHGWYDVRHRSLAERDQFQDKARTLGADNNLFTRNQYTRMPDGFNTKTEKRQSVIYFNPDNIKL